MDIFDLYSLTVHGVPQLGVEAGDVVPGWGGHRDRWSWGLSLWFMGYFGYIGRQ